MSVPTATDPALADQAREVRAFNRFWTRTIGVLEEGLLQTPYTLPQARVLFELAQAAEPTSAGTLAASLDLDPGYLSRLLAGLEGAGLLERRASPEDARTRLVSLTPAGRAAFAELDARSAAEVTALLERLPEERRGRVLAAMRAIRDALDPDAGPRAAPIPVLRPPRPGDYGWIVERHGALYTREYGWDVTFEALVARIVAGFAERHDPRRERAWIAELGGERVGSVLCVDGGEGVARLRLLLVEPAARGRRLGTQLVEECVAFARAAGYRELVLWTQRVLEAARRIYARAGFELVAEEAVPERFGVPQVSETWRLALA